MFSLFKKNPRHELLEQAKAVLHHAGKVWSYRRDLWDEPTTAAFLAARDGVAKLALDATAPAEKLREAIGALDEVLRDTGGTIYPHKTVSEWVELIVVAAIIAGGIRAFFLQPFKIPTNSMYPTYHGMTAEVYPLDGDGPGALERAWMKLTQWAKPVEVRSPVAGEVLIPIDGVGQLVRLPNGQDDGIFGTRLLRGATYVYALNVGQTRVPVAVPQEFGLTGVVLKTYFPEIAALPLSEPDAWIRVLQNAREKGAFTELAGRHFLKTGRMVRAGDRLAHFAVLTGDMVFVDRLSYNFVRPSVGDPFVFATKNIPGLSNPDGTPQDLYYIKRLVGRPGDTLEVKAPVLYRDGEPIAGKPAFEKNNALRTDLNYFGYRSTAYGGDRRSARPLEEPLTLPAHHYYAMGDNSSNSFDSRGWGFVPEKEIIGRGLFILYPFTSRWGAAE